MPYSRQARAVRCCDLVTPVHCDVASMEPALSLVIFSSLNNRTALHLSIHLHTSIPLCLYASIPLYLHTSIPPYLYTSIPLCLHTSILPYLYTSIPLYLHTSIPPYLHTSIPLYLRTIHTYNLSKNGINWTVEQYVQTEHQKPVNKKNKKLPRMTISNF